MIEPTYTLIEAINEFYKLKNKYETKHYEKYVQPIVTSNISKREKRVAYSKLPKHKCVNCERNVGTIWDIKVFEDDRMKYYKAKCGDLENPCPLDIHINYSFSEPIYDSIKQDMSSIEKTKLDIIKTKNYALFFNKNVQDDFNELLELLKLDTENVGYLIETNIIRNHNPDKHKLLKQTIQTFGVEYLLPFNQMVKEYLETKNEIVMNNAVSFYVNEMMPKLREIQLLKYEVNVVEFDEENKVYKLIQLGTSLEHNEFAYSVDNSVVKFVTGVMNEKKSKNSGLVINKKQKTVKTKTKTNDGTKRNKTLKLPAGTIIIDDDLEEV
jgi:hypothetical protein